MRADASASRWSVRIARMSARAISRGTTHPAIVESIADVRQYGGSFARRASASSAPSASSSPWQYSSGTPMSAGRIRAARTFMFEGGGGETGA